MRRHQRSTSAADLARSRAKKLRAFGLTISIVLGLLTPFARWAEALDLRMLDVQFRMLAESQEPQVESGIVIIAIDQPTLAALAEPVALMHVRLGELLDVLAKAGASAVAIDLILPERSFDAVVRGSDRSLILGLLSLRRHAALVLATTVDELGQPRWIYAPFLAAAGKQATGLALLPVDSDGIVRRFDERLGADGSRIESFVGRLLRKMGHQPEDGLIDFSRRVLFQQISMYQVLERARAGDATWLESQFNSKVVLIGTNLSFLDQHRVPATAAGETGTTAGVTIHARALRANLSRTMIRPVPAWLLMSGGALAGFAWLVAATASRATFAVLAALVLLPLASTALLANGWEFAVAGIFIVIAVSAAGRTALEMAIEISARRRLRRTFAGYVSPAVMAELEAGKLDGMETSLRFVSVMFIDVRGFTARSEHTSPESVIAALNCLFEMVTTSVHSHGGTVKEFMGDGVMTFFGAPQSLRNPVQSSFETAKEILHRLPSINLGIAQTGQEPFTIGIGIACGDAVVGHIGATKRHAYGAIGDCVNLASRLEGLSKVLGYSVIMSDQARVKVRSDESLVSLGVQVIKGHSSVEVFGWSPEWQGARNLTPSRPATMHATPSLTAR